MKWLLVSSLFVCFATLSTGSALKCEPGSEDTQCLSENTEKVPESTPSINIIERKKPTRTECLAGSEWESKCHRCRCSEDGLAECSRMDTCENGEYGNPIRCKPKTSFKNDCNTCNCRKNGAVLCTLMECFSLPEKSIIEMLQAKEKRKSCLPGSRWKSKCNECFCTDSGQRTCTEKACLDKNDEPEMACAPETSWKNDCNTCWCNNGSVACTRMECIVETLQIKEQENNCLPGSRWKSKCNECFCTDNGQRACTEKACLDKNDEPEMDCAPETSWKMDCNTCWCNNGSVTCTRKECSPHVEPEMACVPGTSWKNDCNTCWCDNGNVACTRMECVQNIGMLQAKEKRKNCLPGSRWKSKCNECFCTDNGQRACTDKACLDKNDEPEVYCAPETSWKNDCNTCWCNNGHVACTRMGCDQHFVNDFNPVHASSTTEAATEADHLVNAYERKLIKRSALCKSNASFKDNCNNCKCAPDGQSYSCTTHECKEPDVNDDVEVFMESEGADHIERHSVCKPRGIFKIGCNTCLCSVDGMDFTCTNKPCPLPDDVEIFHELRALRSSVSQKVVCTANRMFIKDCNTCWCNEDGTSYFCTRKVCITELPEEITEDKPENLQEIKRKCRPDEVFELDCNMCRCNPDGLSFSCTRRACVPEEMGKSVSFHRRIRATAQEAPKACQPGMEFRMDCNKCLCDNEGQNYSCTRIDCAALNSNGNGGARRKREATTQQVATECEPESVFNKDCNVCRCGPDGKQAICTIKRCKEHNPDEKQENTVTSPESDPGFRCNPGEQFKRDCNDCTCSADGKSVFCTIRFCDQDITPSL